MNSSIYKDNLSTVQKVSECTDSLIPVRTLQFTHTQRRCFDTRIKYRRHNYMTVFLLLQYISTAKDHSQAENCLKTHKTFCVFYNIHKGCRGSYSG
jgi:hypothetical protein